MITFSPKAQNQLVKIIEEHEAVRVAVKGGGCAGMSYTLNICEEYDEEDLLIKIEHVNVYVDPHSALLLTNTIIDFVQTGLIEGFVFNNPNANTTCGCGMSFS
jgi:iron-sulfur cluster assembly protein